MIRYTKIYFLSFVIFILNVFTQNTHNFIVGIGDRFVQDYPPGSGSNWSYVHLKAQSDGCKFTFMTTWIHSGHQWGDLNAPDPGTGGWLKRSDVRRVAEDGYLPLIAFWWFGDSITPDYVQSNMSNWLTAIDNLSKIIDIGNNKEVWILLEPEFNKGGIENWDGWNDAVITAINRFKSNMVNGTKLKIGVSVGDWGLYPETYHLTDCLSRAAADCDFIAFHTMRASTKDDHQWDDIPNPDPEVITYTRELARYLSKMFNKPIFLAYFSISSYGGWEENQAKIINQMFDYRAEFMNYGMLGLGYFNYFDDPAHGGYYGAAEPYMGLVYSNLAKKPGWYAWKTRTDDIYNNTGKCSVAITYPEGGESFIKSPIEINWFAVGNTEGKTFDLYFSSDDGKNYTLLATGLNNTSNSYLWDVTNFKPDVNFRLKIVASDGASYETRRFAINLNNGRIYGYFDFEETTQGWRIPSFDVNAISIERSSDVASYGRYSLKCVTRHSRTSSVTKIGAIEFLNIDLTNDSNKIITMDVYLPFDFGPAIGVTRATIFWHDRDFVWHQGDKEFLLSHGWNRISVNLPSDTNYPIRSVGIKLISDLPITGTFYIDHVMIGSSPDEDRDPPQLTIHNPLDNTEAVSSKMFLSGTVQDNVGIYKCYFTLNDRVVSNLSIVDNVFNEEFSLVYGTNTITVYAEDFSGNISSATVRIFLWVPIDNFPNLFFISPLDNSSVSDIVSVKVEAWDDYGIQKVEFYLNDEFKFVVSTTPYIWFWDTRSYRNGNYRLTAVAYDTSNQNNSSVINVRVENLPEDNEPKVEIISPSVLEEVSGKFKIYALIDDERGISKVEFYINDALIYTDTSNKKGIYEYEINSNDLFNGHQYLKIVAYDTTGNITTSQIIIYVYNKQEKKEFLLTPNNDGVNDIISFSNTTPVNIYDINGLLVKRIEEKNGYWDGKDKNGKVVANGVYIFQIEQSISGAINVIK